MRWRLASTELGIEEDRTKEFGLSDASSYRQPIHSYNPEVAGAELDLAELMAQTIEDILADNKTIGWEAAAKLVKAIKHAYPELLERSL
jgi:hypothetical protein